MRKRDGSPPHIADIINLVFKSNPLMRKRFEQHQIWNMWDDIAGATIRQRARPKRIHDTVLVVEVDHSGWMQELALLKPVLIKKLHQHVAKDLITDIRFELKGGRRER